MRIGTAEADSTFLSQGQALARVLSRRGMTDTIEVSISPAASIDNANRLERGEIDLGFMAANWIGRAKRGETPFTHPIDLSLVAPMNVGPLFFIASKESGIATFDDLAGKRVSFGPAGSGMTQHAHMIFGALGHSIDRVEPIYLSFAAGAAALAAGEIDAQLQCPIPNTVMTALDAAVPLTVLAYSEPQINTLLANVGFYRRTVMRQGALRALTEDATQPGVLNVLVCHARADADAMARVAATIAAGAVELARENALFDSLDDLMTAFRQGTAPAEIDGVALHAGARIVYAGTG